MRWAYYLFALGFVAYSAPADAVATSERASLPTLIDEATERNPEIVEARRNYEAASALKGQARAPYFPELGVEGGAEAYKSGDTRASNGFASAFFRYNLFRGGRDHSTFKARSKEEEFSAFHLSKVKTRIQREVGRQFYELLFLQEAIRLKEEALEINRQQAQMAEKRKRSGITSDADVLEFALREATLRSDLLFLEQEKATTARELGRLLGRDADTAGLYVEGPLEHVHAIGHTAIKRPLGEFLALVEREREDLNEARKNLSVASLAHSATLSGWLPKVDVEADYGVLPRADRVLSETPAWSVQLKVSLPLFSGLENYYERSARAREMERSEVTVYRVRQQVRIQVENAYTRLETVEARVDLEEKNLDRAKRYYDITLSEYKRGIKNSPDVAGAAEKLFDTRLRNLQYRRDSYLGRLSLAEAIGIADVEPLEH